MRKVKLILLLLAVAWFTLPAYAATDHRILLDDPTCSGEDTTQISYTGGTVVFSANGSGGGFFQYCNNTGTTLSLIDVKFINTPGYSIIPTDPNGIVCTSTSGFLCTPSINDGIVDLLFTPFSIGPGDEDVELPPGGSYPNGTVLSFNLNNLADGLPPRDPNGSGGWEPGLEFFWAGNEQAQVVPEPASVLLLGSGLATLIGLRRRRRM